MGRMDSTNTSTSFQAWLLEAEERIRHALIAAFGSQAGEDAAADAIAFAWEHWVDVTQKPNPTGYVFGVGRNFARRNTRAQTLNLPPVRVEQMPQVEPGLPAAVEALSERQRTVVTLLYGLDWTMSEVAELLSVSKSTIQNHAERGLQKLRNELGVEQ